MVVYTVANQKGGVAKSTTAAALVAGFNARGLKSLAIDTDPQGNLSYIMGASTTGKTVLGLLTKEATAKEAIQHTKQGDIIPSSRLLAAIDGIIADTGKEYRLKEALEELAGVYDCIVIDTPPALGILTVNALTAANALVIPAQADTLSLQGIEQLATSIAPVKKYCNPALEIAGILLTRYNPRSVLTKEVTKAAANLAEAMGTKVFDTAIREGIAIKEAQLLKQNIFDYAPKANATQDYAAFIDELLKQGGKDNGR